MCICMSICVHLCNTSTLYDVHTQSPYTAVYTLLDPYSKYTPCNLYYTLYPIHVFRSVIWEKSFRGYVDEMAIKRKLKEQDDTQRGII